MSSAAQQASRWPLYVGQQSPIMPALAHAVLSTHRMATAAVPWIASYSTIWEMMPTTTTTNTALIASTDQVEEMVRAPRPRFKSGSVCPSLL